MRAVIQRVSKGTVSVQNEIVGEINDGIVVLLGISDNDTEQDVEYLVNKIVGLRIFENDEGKF
ncbi:MAG TPA: D-tyrosyl-tRNA(Tyr) deacylase, partial [Thermoanaerobacterales bacterium]|nr:D-tyrosyl-tRNA(Tyr) deacylase [Thermoanaerobacterales bacterium]